MRRYPIHDDFKRYARPGSADHPADAATAACSTAPVAASITKEGRRVPSQGHDPTGRVFHRSTADRTDEEKRSAAALVYFHGGGFVLEAAPYHYALAMTYAAHTPCKSCSSVIIWRRSTPFPLPAEECFAAYLWTLRHVKTLGIRGGNDRADGT